jgi:DNA-binding CsgD family transcriptional regulator
MADPLFATAFADGQRLSRAEAYAEAMAVGTGSVEARPRIALLSARQHEVLQLMADGHTNREIAEILFVSKRTIDGHVASILAKLDAGSRREAVSMARKRGLLVETPVKFGSGS